MDLKRIGYWDVVWIRLNTAVDVRYYHQNNIKKLQENPVSR
jgi:hypothetical protein